MNKRVFVPVVGLPADLYGAQLRTGLLLPGGWEGPWTTIAKQKQIRPGFWGDYADVALEVRALRSLKDPVC